MTQQFQPQVRNPGDTQLSHAALVMQRHPELKFVPGLGWHRWDGSKWTPNAEGHLLATLQDEAATFNSMFPGSFATMLCSRRGLDDVAIIAQTMRGVRVEPHELDRMTDRLCTAGLTWDMTTGEAWPTRPEELSTRALPFEPAAECPEWLQFLRNCFPGEPEMPAYLQRLIGYGLTGRASEQAFVLMHGSGANGKSTFTDALTYAFGPYVQHMPIEVLMSGPQRSGEAPSPMLLKLRGARLVFTSESERGGKLNEPMIKLLTGGDQITARALHKEPVTFKPEALIFMSTNHLPDVQGTDDGIWRRVRLIEWRESFVGREDKGISERLRAEAPGIINWAIEGAMEWAQSGLVTPSRVSLATEAFRDDSDFLGTFEPEWIEFDEDAWMSNRDIREAWDEFCLENGRDSHGTARGLFLRLQARGGHKAGRKGTDGFRARRVGRR